MVYYKQIATVRGQAAIAIQKAINEERALNFKYVNEESENGLVIVVGAETKESEAVDREDLVEEGEELLVAIR